MCSKKNCFDADELIFLESVPPNQSSSLHPPNPASPEIHSKDRRLKWWEFDFWCCFLENNWNINLQVDKMKVTRLLELWGRMVNYLQLNLSVKRKMRKLRSSIHFPSFYRTGLAQSASNCFFQNLKRTVFNFMALKGSTIWLSRYFIMLTIYSRG